MRRPVSASLSPKITPQRPLLSLLGSSKTTLAAVLVLALAFASITVLGLSAAQAQTQGISTSVTLNGGTYNDTKIVNEGDTLNLKMQYSSEVKPGSTVTVSFGSNVSVSDPELPAGATAVKSIVRDGNTLRITFADPWPSDVNQGVLDLSFKVNSVEKSSLETINWTVNGEESSIEVIVKNQNDEFANVTNWTNKGVASSKNWSDFVTYDAATKKVSVSAAILSKPLDYTLTVNTTDAKSGYEIADQLPAGLSYVSSSFTAQQTTWDADGLNKTTSTLPFSPTITAGTFSAAVDLAGPSANNFKYQVVVSDEAARLALEKQLQAQADKINADDGGRFQISLTNKAIFGDSEAKQATYNFGGTVVGMAGPDLGFATFNKSNDVPSKAIEADANGVVSPAVPVTYNLNFNLTGWDGSNSKKTLQRNVVLADTLGPQAKWLAEDANFLTASGVTLRRLDTPVSDEAFKADEYALTYFVDGQRLRVNLGRDSSLTGSVALKAEIVSITGLPAGSTNKPGETNHRFTNRGLMYYQDAGNGLGYNTTTDL